MKITKKVTQSNGGTTTVYRNEWSLFHREDGPAYFCEYDDGQYHEEWWYEGRYHRYGGPAITLDNGKHEYWIHYVNVTVSVKSWLSEREYVWETMTEQEKWELDMFMRTLG